MEELSPQEKNIANYIAPRERRLLSILEPDGTLIVCPNQYGESAKFYNVKKADVKKDINGVTQVRIITKNWA